jgi:hypothetical protein
MLICNAKKREERWAGTWMGRRETPAPLFAVFCEYWQGTIAGAGEEEKKAATARRFAESLDLNGIKPPAFSPMLFDFGFGLLGPKQDPPSAADL